ncbi:hypothetical protein DL96DRAFT_1706579 [Flagelloscypha sp. PMI_526]|nr:hypothetical protein DL96DRAFT_1706579 [Flagelloscypha sp. PMI_526]
MSTTIRFLSSLAIITLATAQQSSLPATPLASKTGFSYPSNIPDKVDTDTGLIRGTQFGYNNCNSSTEGTSSLCQTSFLNALDDFCLWAPSKPDSIIADTEGEEVAWCTKPGRGTRLIPNGALQGVQFMKTSDYIQVVGFIDQSQINIKSDDPGGELDPHGADLRGNPMGGLAFSTAWTGKNDSYTQVIEWHNFMGGNTFCFKVCNPSKSHAADYCQHIFDRIGCAYNAPNSAKNGTFERCEGEVQDFPGVYTDASGATQTFSQPPEGVAPSPPYTPRVPASSNCVQFKSAELFSSIATVIPTSGPFASGGASFSAAASLSSSAAAKATGESGNGARVQADVMGALALGLASTLAGVVGSILFFA